MNLIESNGWAVNLESPGPGRVSIAFSSQKQRELPVDVRLWAEQIGSGHWSESGGFELSVGDFTTFLESFLFALQSLNNPRISYDSYVSGLLSDFLRQEDSVKQALDSPAKIVEPSEVTAGLKGAGFLRWNSQSSDQLRDVGRLLTLSNGANFSVPGAGKTNCLLAVHSYLAHHDKNLRLLIVCPKNALISWDDELRACLGPSNSITRLSGGTKAVAMKLSQEPRYAAITYQQLRTSLAPVLTFVSTHRVHLVLDESHRIKGGEASLQGSAALKLAPYAIRRDILSGTPMPQGLPDLISQFQFLWPGLNLASKVSQVQDPVKKLEAAKASIRPLYVRTRKSELGLTPPVIKYHPIRMGKAQAQFYELLRSEAARELKAIGLADRSLMQQLGKQVMRLLQFSSDPSLLASVITANPSDRQLQDAWRDMQSEESTKYAYLDYLISNLMEREGEKVVIWSMFVKVIEKIEKRYAQYGTTSIHGGIPTGTDDSDEDFREARIRKFNEDPNCRIMVANPAACGEGISLHKAAHNAIYFDRSYNAAHFLQSIDRIHRRGLPPEVETRVQVLITERTIEESVAERLSVKISSLEKLLDDEDLSAMVYDPEDIESVEHVDGYIDKSDVTSIERHILG